MNATKSKKIAAIVVSLLLVVTLCCAAGIAYAFNLDKKLQGIIPDQTSIDGIDVSGLSREEAQKKLEAEITKKTQGYRLNLQAVKEAAQEPAKDSGSEQELQEDKTQGTEALATESIDLSSCISTDFSKQLDEALEPNSKTDLSSKALRVYKYLSKQQSQPRSLKLEYKFNQPSFEEKLKQLASAVAKDPQDASRSISGDKVSITPEEYGQELPLDASAQIVEQKLAEYTKEGLPNNKELSVELPITSTEPSVLASSFGKVITINLSSHKLHLFNGDQREKSYIIGCGKPGYETPTGLLKIVNKRKNPSWHNPDPEGWGAEMPEVIGPGPDNPLGPRALDLNRTAIRIHGVKNHAKLGISGSHGCINMSFNDVIDLFDRVSVGTPVNVHY